MSQQNQHPIINPMPPVVVALFLVIIVIEGIFFAAERGYVGGAGGIGWRMNAIQNYGINTGLVQWMFENGHFPSDALVRFVTFSFVNGSLISTLVGCALFLAMGKMVGSVFSTIGVLVVFFVPAGIGALIYCLIIAQPQWVFGIYPVVYGFIGAYTFLTWVMLRAQNGPQHQAFYLIAMLMVIQLVFGMLFSGGSLWIVELSSFCVGFLVSFFVAPGGFSRILAIIRRD